MSIGVNVDGVGFVGLNQVPFTGIVRTLFLLNLTAAYSVPISNVVFPKKG